MAERQRSDLAKEMEKIGDRLDEAGGATAAQSDLNKKRENEVQKLRKDLEEANIQHEAVLLSLKKKHGDAILEMTEQITQLSAMKSKIEKDKGKIHLEANDARSATDEIGRAKSSSEKSNKILATSLNELGKKVEEANMTLGDFESQKRRLAAENADLLRVVGDINNNVNMINKMKQSLVAALDDTKHVADTEARERQLLVGKFKNLEHELDGMKEHLDEELASYDEIARSRGKIGAELEEMTVNLDQAQILNNLMEKKAKQFDKIVGEWKRKVDGLATDLDVAQKECRNASSELFKIKA